MESKVKGSKIASTKENSSELNCKIAVRGKKRKIKCNCENVKIESGKVVWF